MFALPHNFHDTLKQKGDDQGGKKPGPHAAEPDE